MYGEQRDGKKEEGKMEEGRTTCCCCCTTPGQGCTPGCMAGAMEDWMEPRGEDPPPCWKLLRVHASNGQDDRVERGGGRGEKDGGRKGASIVTRLCRSVEGRGRGGVDSTPCGANPAKMPIFRTRAGYSATSVSVSAAP